MTASTDTVPWADPFAPPPQVARRPAPVPTGSGGTPVAPAGDAALFPDTADRHGRTRRKRRDYLAVAALLYGPDDTLATLAAGQVPPDAHTPSAGRGPTRRTSPSRLPKSVVLSKHLAEARAVSDHLLAVRRAALVEQGKDPDAVHATNSWLEYADTLLRVARFTAPQVTAVIDWFAGRGLVADTITNMYMVRKKANQVVTDDRFRAEAARAGVTFTDAQIADAWARLGDNGPGPRRGGPAAMPRDAESGDWGGSQVVTL